MCFLDHTVPDTTRVRNEDRILRAVQQIQNCREDLAFSFWIILWETQIELQLQSLVYRSVTTKIEQIPEIFLGTMSVGSKIYTGLA